MKKAIVLGVMAFFAINIATVQQAKAQDKKDVKTEKVELKSEKTIAKPAPQLQKAENTEKACDKKACDKKEKSSCCSKDQKDSKNVKAEDSKVTTDKMTPKEIKVEKGQAVKPEKKVKPIK